MNTIFKNSMNNYADWNIIKSYNHLGPALIFEKTSSGIENSKYKVIFLAFTKSTFIFI